MVAQQVNSRKNEVWRFVFFFADWDLLQRMMARAVESPQQPEEQRQRQASGYSNYLDNAVELDDALLEQERSERSIPAPANEEQLNEQRRSTRPDNVSNAIYHQSSGKAFWRKK